MAINVTVRAQSAKNPEILKMLKYEASRMINHLMNKNIQIEPVKINIWIKQYGDSKFYPKVEFDFDNQELQYDLNYEGQIVETHYKTFLHNGNNIKRKDIPKEELNSLLDAIDNEISSIYTINDTDD
jgi:hypothetical protein